MFTRGGNNADERRALSTLAGGVRGRNKTRAAEKGRHISFFEEKKRAREDVRAD